MLLQQKPTLFGWSLADLRSSSLSRPDLPANASSSEARAGSGLRLGTLTAKGRSGELNVPLWPDREIFAAGIDVGCLG